MKISYALYLLVILTLMFMMWAVISKIPNTPEEKPCEDYRETILQYVPAKCLSYFNQK